jgi:hypothetical protein
MKQSVFIFLFSFVSCVFAHAQTNPQEVKELLKGVISLDETSFNETRPIPSINKVAAQQADTIFFLTKNNINQVFREAKKYQSCIITVGQHTVVFVKSWTNCSKSGSWNYCMPDGTGFIQRDEMVKKEDYIKNIIGTPDAQRRTVFLFNKK